MSDEPRLQIDSDWKEEARREKERLAEQEAKAAGGRGGPLPEASFLELLNMLAMQAVVAMGGYQLPTGEVVPPDLGMAKHQIDLLEVLEKKTAGNLADDEKKALSAVLYELRMQFVELTRAAARPPAQGGASIVS